jgi:hypothetical protein
MHDRPPVLPKPARKLLQNRLRNRAWLARVAEAKRRRGNRQRFYLVPLFDAEVNVLLLDTAVKPSKADARRRVTENELNRQWKKHVGLVIAAAARKTIKK